MDKARLSVAVITKNEENMLPDCLRSVSFADDIVVVDSGSSDRTAQIAREFGARVFVEGWKGYGPQKNSAVAKCNHDWVLILDADERVPSETASVIINAVNAGDADAYSFPRRNYFHGRWIRHCDWWPDETIRLVRRSKGSFKFLTHERWITEGKTGRIESPIDHYSFRSYSDMLKVVEDRTTVMAREMFDAGKRTTAMSAVLNGMGMFFKIYFLKRGFLEGFDGFVISLSRAIGVFFKYAKLLEMQRHGEGRAK